MFSGIKKCLGLIIAYIFTSFLLLIVASIPLASVIGIATYLEPFISEFSALDFPPTWNVFSVFTYIVGFTATTSLVALYTFLAFFYGKDSDTDSKIKSTFMTSIILVSVIRYISYTTSFVTYQAYQGILSQSLVLLPLVGVVFMMRTIFMENNKNLRVIPVKIITEFFNVILDIQSNNSADFDIESYIRDVPIIREIKKARSKGDQLIMWLLILPIVALSSMVIEVFILSSLGVNLFLALGILTILVVFLSTSW